MSQEVGAGQGDGLRERCVPADPTVTKSVGSPHERQTRRGLVIDPSLKTHLHSYSPSARGRET